MDFSHHSKIEFEIDGMRSPDLELELVLVLKIDAAVVTVREGDISDIGPGKASAEALLAMAGNTLVKRQVAEVDLGTIRPVNPERPAVDPMLLAQSQS